MRSSADPDPLDAALRDATARIVRAVSALGLAAPTVLIDGRSGAGKSSLAARVAAAWPLPAGVAVLALDSVYPGWDGLRAGAKLVADGVLRPRAANHVGTWSRWDWTHARAAEQHRVDPHRGLIVEGSGVLTPTSAPLADITVWVDADEAVRRRRALARDGDAYRPHWQRWAAQERAHMRADNPQPLAGLTVMLP